MPIIALALLLLSLAASPAAADRTVYDRAQCRLAFAQSLRALSSSLALHAQNCHRDRMRGRIAPTIDCNDPWSWEAAGYGAGTARVDRDLGRFRARSLRCPASVPNAAAAGYVACPAPCDGLPVSSFPEFGLCLECLSATIVPDVLAATFGEPPAPAERLAINCSTTIGRGLIRHFFRRKKLQNDCEFLVEIDKVGFVGVDCADLENPSHPYAARMQRFRERAESQIARKCAGVDLAVALDACATTAPALATCTLETADAWTDAIHPALYPPLP